MKNKNYTFNDNHLQNIKDIFGEKTRIQLSKKKEGFVSRKLVAASIAIVLCFSIAVPALAVNIPVIYDLMYLVSPSVAQFFKPVQKSDEDIGIKMEVVSAFIHGDTAEIYITLQDLTSDRIDGTTDLHDSYFINRPFDCSASCKTVGYDEETKTATFLISITDAGKRDITGDKITFIVKAFLSHKNYYDIEIPIDISDVGAIKNTQQVNSIGGGGRNYPFDGPVIPAALIPSEPTQNLLVNGIELTGIGFIDGQLHIQTAVYNPLSNGNYSSFYLMDRDGDIVEYDYNFYFSNSYEQPEQRIDYCEFVFNIAEEESRSFLIMGQFVTSDMRTEGDWTVTFPLENNVPDYSPVAINGIITDNAVLSIYIADGGLSQVVLKENNEFFVQGRPEINYNPTGSYEIDGNKLYLNVSENQQFIFTISGNSLIFESGEWLENWISKETVFMLLEE